MLHVYYNHVMHCVPTIQLADAMELMLLSVLGPAVKCQWGLSTAEEAAITSVSYLLIYHSGVTHTVANWLLISAMSSH